MQHNASDQPTTTWRKSTYSGGDSGQCLEVDDTARPTHIPVRDSKNPTGATVTFGDTAWTAFIGSLKATRG
ncbi:DUF397 domain-containing protein [Streptomyces sp. VRA16 Mangrove soil]|uniref:DUF397 domain-containing protein n=1 Tax=Streptomyces sp. VRA16 Mangrove soil TaxID=2817434 RepID=UPI001A9F157C|nr:DUF397 domain-containing protein [Streptomyces sp. VRA16 Mangrove soil]MBO1334835.1 DUF397 domain-containing protein [Streptomyces sp. VRA16 Mangrove soil]